eukprot:gene15914-17514_t
MADENAVHNKTPKYEKSLSPDRRDREIVEQFCSLMEKARKLFDGLRATGNLNLEGHLTLTQNLRTSDSNYLFEAFQFYSAIRTRNYFNQNDKEEKPGMLVKRLRYFARFLVVCLLLNEVDLVRDLLKDLKRYVAEYTSTVDANDQAEWQLADSVLTVMGENVMPITLKHRVILERIPSTSLKDNSKLRLQEVVIVANCEKQIKFSELTLDMFRFLQCIEKEPENLRSYKIKIPNGDSQEGKIMEEPIFADSTKNPHKYLLYKPSFGQLITFLSASFKDLPHNGIMMLYLSADASTSKRKSSVEGLYEAGGVTTNKRREHTNGKRAGNMKEAHCLFPEDLIIFTRKPLVLVVDSSNSFAFKNMPKLFGQPLVCFMSPVELPEDLKGSKNGGLFTLFCYDPLLAFCTVCNITDLRQDLWDKCQQFVDQILSEQLEIFCAHIKEMDCAFEQFIGDDFIRLLILRFIFCYQTLRLHKHFKGPTYYPSTSPPLSKEIFNHKGFARHLLELASLLNAREFFNEWTEIPGFDLGAM